MRVLTKRRRAAAPVLHARADCERPNLLADDGSGLHARFLALTPLPELASRPFLRTRERG